LIDKKDPAIFNQAIMEFGSLQCKPVNPDCSQCIFNKTCFAFNNEQVKDLPVKIKSLKPRNRYFNYLFIKNNKDFFIRKRVGDDIWKHLYELPLIETHKPVKPHQIINNKDFLSLTGTTITSFKKIIQTKHQLSHQTIY